MIETSDVERADRIGRRRARLFAVQAILFITWQGLFISAQSEAPMRNVDLVRQGAWILWVVALLIMLATGGALLRGRRVRELLNDELTRKNRTRAYAIGFWAGVGASIGLYAVALFEPVTGRDAVHIAVSAALGAALLTFARLERRSAQAG